MPTQQFSNYVSTTLNGSITSGAVSLVVSSAAGFPTSGNFQIVIDNNEICQVTAVAGTTYTVTRAYEAINGVQVASAHSNGAPVVIVLTVQGLSLGFARLDQGNTFVGAETFNNDVTFGARAVFSTAISKIVPGATSISIRNNADNADNAIITDVGLMTIRAGLVITAGGLTVTAGKTTLASHLKMTGTVPTLGALQTGINTQSIAGNDTTFQLTLATTGSPPGAAAAIAIVNFNATFTNPPAFAVSANGWNAYLYLSNWSATTITINTSAAMPISGTVFATGVMLER